jgi:hypothetical protein
MAAPSHYITLPAGKIYVAPVGTTPVADAQYYLGQTDGADIDAQPKIEERWSGTSNGLLLDDVFPIATDVLVTVRCIESRDNVLGMGLMADYTLVSGAMRFTPRAALLTGGRFAFWHIPDPVFGRARQLHVRKAIALPNGPIRLKRGANGEKLQVVELRFRVLNPGGGNPPWQIDAVPGLDQFGGGGRGEWMADGQAPLFIPGIDPEWAADGLAPLSIPGPDPAWEEDLQTEIASSGCCQFEPPAKLSIYAVDANKAEGDEGVTNHQFWVARHNDTRGPATAVWIVTGHTDTPAEAGDFEDGVFPSGIVDFADGEEDQFVYVPVAGDLLFEADKGYAVTLFSPVNAELGTATAYGTIVYDDFVTWDPGAKWGSILLSNGNLTAASSETQARSIVATRSHSAGIRVFDVHVDALPEAFDIHIGLMTTNDPANMSGIPGANYGWSWMLLGNLYSDGFVGAYASAGQGATIRVIANFEDNTIRYKINGEDQGVAFTDLAGPAWPAVGLHDSLGQSAQVTAQFHGLTDLEPGELAWGDP